MSMINRLDRSRATFGRFTAVLSTAPCSRPVYDQVLFELAGCVIAPTLGSILPNWLLVIPRVHALNFAAWRAKTAVEPHLLIAEIAEHCQVNSGRIIWFEHGAAAPGSAIGCGVEHAHLHVIVDAPFSFDAFASAAVESSRLEWREHSSANSYRGLKARSSYLVMASEDRALVSAGVESVGSQFFRHTIARLADQPHAWDYKEHPNLHNVRKTIENFRRRSVPAGEHRGP
jgi:ATP adenylyltransferase